MTTIAGSSLTSFVFCWRLERRDGAGLAITSHDQPLRVEDVVFEPTASLDPASITRGGLQEVLSETKGALISEGLCEDDLLSGRWGGALSKLSAVEWAGSRAPQELVCGELGEVGLEGTSFRSDLLGPSAKLNTEVCPATSPECRASFGDRRCRVDLAGRSLRVGVVSISANELTLDSSINHRFARGQLRWLSGPNCGLKSYITQVVEDTIHLREPPPFAISCGERVQLREGCDKRLQTCRDRFGNVANFRGEPHLPGNDLLTRYPGF